MRIPLVAGNWKMYKIVSEARHLVSEMVPGLQAVKGVEKVLCPPFTDLMAVAALVEGTDIGLGAQNMYWESAGAFTGRFHPPWWQNCVNMSSWVIQNAGHISGE